MIEIVIQCTNNGITIINDCNNDKPIAILGLILWEDIKDMQRHIKRWLWRRNWQNTAAADDTAAAAAADDDVDMYHSQYKKGSACH